MPGGPGPPGTGHEERSPKPLSPALLALWARTLAQGLHGGLTLTRALQLLVDQEGSRPLGRVATQLRDQVAQGQTLSAAMIAAGRFPPVVTALVQAGEAGGGLEQAFERIASSAERHAELSGKIQAALAYPALILCAGGLTITGMILFVLPKLTAMFTEMGQTLPWPTQIMLALRGLIGWGALGAVVAGLAVRAALRVPAQRARVTEAAARALGALPVLGPVLQQAELARWSSTLGLMVAQGVALPRAIILANQTVGAPSLRRRFSRLETDVVEGVSLSEGLRRSGVAAPLLITMTAIGEAEGALDQSLLGVAATFEREVDRGVKIASSLLEPILILAMGLIVAAIVFAMLLPIFEINFTGG
ncbi:MAG: type II secretion system F family protein [Candidatus Omnitrophica bacterium]|nr:type II secretion system F family protein [Candidatus Omnitrophota bacterium]